MRGPVKVSFASGVEMAEMAFALQGELLVVVHNECAPAQTRWEEFCRECHRSYVELPGAETGGMLVASDGGVFSFGDAKFYGSLGATRLPAPAVSMVATKSGKGYWIVLANGDVHAFGDAGKYGSG